MAASSIANIVKSSLGPVGLDKMLVDDVGDVTITNDGATILQLLEVEHPAAKVLVELAALQDEEVRERASSVLFSSFLCFVFLSLSSCVFSLLVLANGCHVSNLNLFLRFLID